MNHTQELQKCEEEIFYSECLVFSQKSLVHTLKNKKQKTKPFHVLQRWAKWLQGGGGDMGVDKDKIKTPAPKQPLTKLTGPLSCEGSDISSFNNFGCTFIEASVPLF